MFNPYNNQMYMNDLQQMRDRIDRQMQMANQNNQQPTPITQNFQIAPNQNNQGIKYVNSTDDVRNELVFVDTLFVTKDFKQMWFKNASGDIKNYTLTEIVEMDEKDKKIAELMARIDNLEKEKSDEQYVTKNDAGATSIKKSSSSKSDNTGNE